MIDLIQKHRSDVDSLCQRWQVKTLELFGSAANGAWLPETSDLDFLVDFLPMEPSAHSRAYFGLWFGLQDLFGRSVDLVEAPAIRNRYFKDAIEESRQELYAA